MKRLGLLVLCVLMLLGCQRSAPDYKEQFFAFGSLVEISLYGVEQARARAILGDIGKQLDRMHHNWHPWQDGELGKINAAMGAEDHFTVSPELAALIQRSRELASASDGLLDPAMGGLLKLWGFSEDPPKQVPPSASEIQALLRAGPVMTDVSLHGRELRITNPAVRLDFGAIAQGYAVDWIVAELRRHGVANAIINVSGDLRILGQHGDRPWRVGIRNPRSGQGDVLAALDMHDSESIVTSGDYERFYVYQGKRYHHIIDPRTGYPSRGVSSVTVLADSATLADAASTILMINGLEGWHALAQRLGVHGVMMVAQDGTVYMDPEMARRLAFELPPIRQVVSAPL